MIRLVVKSSHFLLTKMSAPTAEPSSVLQQAINFINSEFGDNIKSLTKARQLSDQIKTTTTSLEKQVRFNVREKTKACRSVATSLSVTHLAVREFFYLQSVPTLSLYSLMGRHNFGHLMYYPDPSSFTISVIVFR